MTLAGTAHEYQLHALLANRSFELDAPGLVLRPCIFWFDSNHLVDVERALEIYKPFTLASPGMRARLGGKGLNRFRLRRGDFIEDRFGVEQRNLLVGLRDEPCELLETFDWFGSYLLEETVDREIVGAADPTEAPAGHGAEAGSFLDRLRERPLMLDRQGRATFVVHLE